MTGDGVFAQYQRTSRTITGGRLVTLLAEDGETWLNLDTVKAIQSMASQAGATFVLIWDEETMAVQFRHNDPPAAAFQPIWPNHGLFIGTMKLMTV
ncbi:MAG: hypothetical protein HQL07_13960 [Nitrospirae bacterium]|nr:hypothetical protein [Magnetococcales bacterium]HAT50245.1 hypothetical protein [Alphaproteobacteria bacterium]